MIFRPAQAQDVDELVDVQQEGALAGLAHVFPQDQHPFPRAAILARWRAELGDPGVRAYVSTDGDGAITGFAATRDDQLLHFGTALDRWGIGLAGDLHDAVLAELRPTLDGRPARLWVFDANERARRFYARRGWQPTGQRSRSTFAPFPVLLELSLSPRD